MKTTPVVIFLHRGEYDSVHQGLAIAAAAVTIGRHAELYFFWWALEKLIRGELGEPDCARDDVNATLELRGVPTARQLLELLRNSELATMFACSGSMAALGFNPPDLENGVDAIIGWPSILQRTQGVIDRFYL